MTVRRAKSEDMVQILSLFEATVRTINAKDYSKEQIEIWSSAKNREIWLKKINDQFFYVAQIEDLIVGFSSIDHEGYLDFMYVHKDYQRRGIANMLLDKVESKARELSIKKISSSVSITAQPFFHKRGYHQDRLDIREMKGVTFVNSFYDKTDLNNLFFDHFLIGSLPVNSLFLWNAIPY